MTIVYEKKKIVEYEVVSWWVNVLGTQLLHMFSIYLSQEEITNISQIMEIVKKAYTMPFDTMYTNHS